MSEKISNKVYEKITKEDVKMKSCGYFKAKSSFWLIFAGFLFAMTSLVVSIDIYYVSHLKPMAVLLYNPALLLLALPYFFFALTIILLYFTSRAYRRSRHMCRHEEWLLYVVLFFGSFLLGLSVHAGKMNNSFRVPMERNAIYQKTVMTPKYFWSRPEKGTLSGVVLERHTSGGILMKSWDGKKWSVVMASEQSADSAPKSSVKILKMIGTQNGDGQFVAERVWQW